MPLNKTIDILRFWRDVEIFNIPTTPKRERKETIRSASFKVNSPLPWQNHPRKLFGNRDKEWTHAVFIGVMSARNWAEIVLKKICPAADLQDVGLDDISGDGWLAAFAVNEHGQILEGSYVPASFACAFREVMDGKTLDGLHEIIRKATDEFAQRHPKKTISNDENTEPTPLADASSSEKKQDAKTEENTPQLIPIGWQEINDELKHILQNFGSAYENQPLEVVIKSTLRSRKRSGATDAEQNIDFLNSFYLNDLDQLIRQSLRGETLGTALSQYLDHSLTDNERVDILQQSVVMAECLNPKKITAGRWPSSSKHHLMLAQQAAVGEINSQLKKTNGLVAVNGPPGTGKTTLLRDVIAEVVTQRAVRLSYLDSPDALFGSKIVVGGVPVYPLRHEIVDGTGIVVASNNNTAVENITRELPAITEIASDEYPSSSYFKEVANHVFGQAKIKTPAWGLIAAALGNNKNRREFANALFSWGEQEPFQPGKACDIKTYLSASPSDALANWTAAKQEFLGIFKEVEDIKHAYEQVWSELREIETLKKAQGEIANKVSIAKSQLETLPKTWEPLSLQAKEEVKRHSQELSQAQKHARTAELLVSAATDRLEVAQHDVPLSFIDRGLKLVGIITERYRAWHKATLDLRIHRAQALDAWAHARRIVDEHDQSVKTATTALQKVSAEWDRQHSLLSNLLKDLEKTAITTSDKLERIEKNINSIQSNGSVIPDGQFFDLDFESKHLASAWVTPSFDALRSKLFLAALRLHETTLVACQIKAIANLQAASRMLNQSLPLPLSESDKHKLWNILFFTVPVVSSTLASFDRLFSGLGSESLGWLLIDEAGQATPQSVVGALWRSKRAVIIGDPLQIEPVVTVPAAIVSELMHRHTVEALWSPVTQSAQTVADRTMTLGAWIGEPYADTSVWTGLPLRAHRRCIDPMFSVSNRIAYHGQMVQGNNKPSSINCILGESAWFNISGRTSDGQVVHDEIKCLESLLIALSQEWPTVNGQEKASLYIISPFRKVAMACKDSLNVISNRNEFNIDSGTVHRFQGKAADIVIVVLGSAPGAIGSGSRAWASVKPNILNVALTRAKQRIYIIGNYADWSNLPYFNNLANALPVLNSSFSG